MALIQFTVVVLSLATAAPNLPGMELLLGRKTESPVEESECEEHSVKFAGTRHRKIGVKATRQWTGRRTSSERPRSIRVRPWLCRASSRVSHSLPNGLPAPLIC